MIAKTVKVRKAAVEARNKVFRSICTDVLASETSRVGSEANIKKVKEIIAELVDRHCGHIPEAGPAFKVGQRLAVADKAVGITVNPNSIGRAAT